MNQKTWQMTRRSVLRGLGTAIALPWLEAMTPAAEIAATGATAGAGPATAPLRMAFFYVPNGVHMADWVPKQVGSDFELPHILEPLANVKDSLTIVTGLAQQNAFDLGDGAGDHARSLATFLTGCHPLKTDGADLRAGVSVDQVAAAKIGRQTRFASLELGCDRGAQSGNCDSGYSCAYSSNISWRSESTPMAKEVNPRLVFDRLFASRVVGESASARAKRELYKKSILDYVAEDATTLKSRLGVNDQRKVEEYLTGIRELEVRLAKVDSGAGAESSLSDVSRPKGIPQSYEEHIRLMFDLLVLAFQGDVTRISSFMYANEGSTKSYAFIGVPEGHHDLSHHGGDAQKHEKIKKINRFHMTQFAYFLEKLKAIKEGDATLLDRSMIVYGSGISDGDRHNHDDLPVLLLGKGGGSIRSNRHLKLDKSTPMNNLYLSMLDRVGVSVDRLGDSTGKLDLS
ncbi:DUF1552 domain-containing protein [Singulisphaera sp. PoT]|uniref:DUF1552 domain-containing protein n=1 Tax=Singulisphaera sp. PoT TaxID=3411797 RepID=UPI003BF59B7A